MVLALDILLDLYAIDRGGNGLCGALALLCALPEPLGAFSDVEPDCVQCKCRTTCWHCCRLRLSCGKCLKGQ